MIKTLAAVAVLGFLSTSAPASAAWYDFLGDYRTTQAENSDDENNQSNYKYGPVLKVKPKG